MCSICRDPRHKYEFQRPRISVSEWVLNVSMSMVSIASIAILVISFCNNWTKRPEVHVDFKHIELPITSDGQNYIIQVALDGHNKKFCIDTGASSTMIKMSEFKPTHMSVGVGGLSPDGEWNTTIYIGPVGFTNVFDVNKMEGLSCEGLLGKDFFSHFSRFQIDNKRDLLILEQ